MAKVLISRRWWPPLAAWRRFAPLPSAVRAPKIITVRPICMMTTDALVNQRWSCLIGTTIGKQKKNNLMLIF
jgi:hypothetical protein